jgi:hypothetical protein
MHSTSLHNSYLVCTLILFSHHRLDIPSGFPTKILYAFLTFPRTATYTTHLMFLNFITLIIRWCIQKCQEWPPGASTENGTALCHKVQLYRYFVSQCSEFCRHNPLCCFSTSVYCCSLFRYRLSPETFGYILIW